MSQKTYSSLSFQSPPPSMEPLEVVATTPDMPFDGCNHQIGWSDHPRVLVGGGVD